MSLDQVVEVGFLMMWLSRGKQAPPEPQFDRNSRHLRADRRHRRCRDDIVAGAHWRRAQLGLPAIAGCEMRPSRCSPLCVWDITTRPALSAIRCFARSPAAQARCRSCTASAENAGSQS
jgi:hypothetical protein